MKSILVTGGTGFIGKRLVKALMREECIIYLLARPSSVSKAKKMFKNGKVVIVKGDVTEKELGIAKENLSKITGEVQTIYYLSALYDPDASKEEAYKQNVLAAQNLLDFSLKFRNLKLINYLSTAFFCGLYEGKVEEKFYEEKFSYRNNYEWSKHLAELRIKNYLNNENNLSKVPVIIYRPSIVIGDSKTGETDKFDGFYKLLKLIESKKLRFLPGKAKAELNLVPVDFVVDSILKIDKDCSNISKNGGRNRNMNRGQIFHLVDPSPLSYNEVISYVCERYLLKRPKKIPSWIISPIISLVLFLNSISKNRMHFSINSGAVKSLNVNTQFTCSNNLDARQISCPPLRAYLDKILDFYWQKEDLENKM